MQGVPGGQPMPPVQPIQPAGPQYPGAPNMPAPGMPMVQQVQLPPEPKKDIAGLVKTIVIILLSLVAVTFIGLFIWMMLQYDEARTDVDGQIERAVLVAKDEQAQKDEAEFLEREKYPYKTFSGPADYGELTFQYPKTWSVYVAQDASMGGDFEAYFNPVEVETVSGVTINALRLNILNQSFDNVVQQYQGILQDPNGGLNMTTIDVDGTAANRYEGKIPGTEFNGIFVVFKIRDKTAVLRTDSVLFADDFNKLIETVTFNG